MKKAPRNRELLAELRDTRSRLAVTPPNPESALPASSDVDTSPGETQPAAATPSLPPFAFPWPEGLLRQLDTGRWQAADLVAAMAAVLPPDFPELRYGEELICPRGCYRALERAAKGTVVRLHLSTGTRDLAPAARGIDYERWLTYFRRRASTQPEHAANQMLCSELIEHLESFSDFTAPWVKTINPQLWNWTAQRCP